MKPLQRKHKVYAAVIGAGLLFLGVDRLLLDGGAAPSDALGATDASGSLPLQTPEVMTLATSGIPVLPFPKNLPPPSELPDGSRDMFASPLERQTGSDALSHKPSTAEASPGATEFAARHRLDGTLVSPSQKLAIVDGKRLRIGQQLEGFTLVEIVNQAAVFRLDGELATLRTADPLTRAAAPADAPIP